MVSCSIVIPTHNRDDLLVRAVRSALKSCPTVGEVLVVDDKSLIPAAQVLTGETDPRLRVIVNTGQKGAASTRNLGVSSARGDVVFFLDDDDVILPGYCERILAPGGPVSQADWGFSSVLIRQQGQSSDTLLQRKRLCRGVAPVKARVRDSVAATSDGFWIRKVRFDQVGGFDPEQTIDEDTDLCVRLLGLGHRPWYEPEPGMLIYRGFAPARVGGAQLTTATPISKGLMCYRRTYDKNADRFGLYSVMRWFLVTRYLRRAVKAGRVDVARDFVRSQAPWMWSRMLAVYVILKRFKHS
ncbi:MAG: glycosyltransferase [Hydrogenophaga sp.]|uniref:glycosyltransferase family 2 protein n=1 Tax=Hydrogenophaga sp. TaxID=1904254 RepID=UPI002AB889D2|nr:glycosyltransferase [Hydrogenophaga sp.]MDZ4187158.1 glycosyltransferase [Hydrogenophaga sp.]